MRSFLTMYQVVEKLVTIRNCRTAVPSGNAAFLALTGICGVVYRVLQV